MDPEVNAKQQLDFIFTFQAHNAEECAMHCMNDGGCKGFVVGHNTDGTATAVCNIVSD